MYGIEVSPTLISNVTNKIIPLIKEWQNRPLQGVYAVVFLDAIHFKVKQDGAIVNKAAYMVIGIDLDGSKDVLGMWIGENESAKFWLSVLNDLKNRGVQDILITCVDNLTGFTQAISACYPKTEIQKCIIYPPEIRKLIYTTNIIESYHRQLRKVTKGKSIFGVDEALLKMLYLATMDVTRKWTGRVQNWGQMLLQLSVFYPDHIGQHLR